MIKTSLQRAIGVSIGCTIGGCILPGLFFAQIYDASFPPIWKQILLYLVVGYAVCFVVFLGINYAWVLLNKKR